MGSIYPGKYSQDRDVTNAGCTLCHRQTLEHISVNDIFQGLNWQTLQDRRKDPLLCILYRIDRELVAIKNDRRLIAPKGEQGKTTEKHSRPSFASQTEERCLSSQGQCETGMPCHRTTQKWTHSVFLGQGVSLVMSQMIYCFKL